MTEPRGHAPEHGTHYHLQPEATAKRTRVKTRPNSVTTKGTGAKTKGGTGMAPKHR